MPSCLSTLRVVLFSILLACWVALAPQSALAQDAAAPVGGGYLELPTPDDEETAVRDGAALERARRWVEAIGHYEAALERYPENRNLIYGLRRAKIHFGIDRRYSDASFERMLLQKSPSDALALFSEIYDQVGNNYVEEVGTTSFTAHGTESLYLALANDKFLSRNIPRADAGKIAALRQKLRDSYWNKKVDGTAAARATIQEVCRLAQSYAGLSETAVIMEYVFGGCNALDDYSGYLTPDRLDDLYGNIEGEFVGLGIEMQAETGRGMLLINVLPDSPAETGGMQPGEHIVSINGVDCRGMTTDEAARLLRGPSGSTVELELRSTSSDHSRRGEFVRRPVVVKSVDKVQMLDAKNGVGYIRMSGFQKSTAEELDAALATLEAQGMHKLVWDLRGNPGGLLTAAVEVLDRFIESGPLVSTKGRSLDQNWTYSAHRSGTHTNIEIVLLVDGDSASASEIVAGAIRDHKRGVIVGQQTFGKWSVQSILPIREQTGLRLTTAKFYSPKGLTLGKIGVRPDIVVDRALAGVVPDQSAAPGQVNSGYRAGDVAQETSAAQQIINRLPLLEQPEIKTALGVFSTGQAVSSR